MSKKHDEIVWRPGSLWISFKILYLMKSSLEIVMLIFLSSLLKNKNDKLRLH